MKTTSPSSVSPATSTDRDATADVLRHLIETCKDGAQGFKTAADDAKDATLRALFQKFSAQRSAFVHELQARLTALGCDPKEAGSVSGSLHRGWINLRAALTSDEPHAVLAECERGEDAAVAAYRDALQKLTDPETVELVHHQSAAVLAAHNEVRDLRDSAAGRKS